EREKTTRYGEAGSRGPGADKAARVAWARKLGSDEVKLLTAENVLGSHDGWNPKAVPKTEAAPVKRPDPYEHPALKGRVKRDIEYAQAGGESLKLDAFVPKGKGPFPAVIFVHGGGWSAGDKAGGNDPLFAPVAARGIAWFTINYRLAPKHHY